jgi:hypothetical protein
VKLSNTQIVVIAGAAGLVGLYLMKRQSGEPFSLGNLFRTIMPNSPTQQQRAMMFAAQSTGYPDRAGTAGYGSTSVQPAYAGLLPGLGSAVTALFTKIAGPGNTAPSSRPQASASSGGGVSQPTPGVNGWTDLSESLGGQVYFGEFDNSFGDFGDDMAAYGSNYTPAMPYAGPEAIVSDQGTFDVASGTWY